MLVLAGSTTVQPYGDSRLEALEIGGSIFVGVNRNLWRASDEFGLERIAWDEDDGTDGVWDGQQFRITVSTLRLCWNTNRGI